MKLQGPPRSTMPDHFYLFCKQQSARTSSCTEPTIELPIPSTGLWSALAQRPSSSHHMSKLRSFDRFKSFHGGLTADSADSSCHDALASPSSSAIQVAGRHHRDQEQEMHDRAYTRHQSAPVDVVLPCQWRSHREERRKQGSGNVQRRRRFKEEDEEAMGSEEEEEEEEEEGEEEAAQQEEERLPPHEELAREREAATSCGGTAFSLCQGVGRTLKGRDLCRVRNAILKQTGFIS